MQAVQANGLGPVQRDFAGIPEDPTTNPKMNARYPNDSVKHKKKTRL